MNRFMMIIVICIAVLMTSSSTKAMGDENEPVVEASPESTQQFKLEEVYTHEYQDTIVDAIFDTATVDIETARSLGWKETFLSENVKGNSVEIVYPKVLITQDSLKFMDVEGKLKKAIDLNVKVRCWDKTIDEIQSRKIKIRLSDNEKYIGILKPRDVNMLEGMSMGDLIIYNTDGEKQWELDSTFLSGGDIRISPNGEYALGMRPGEVFEGYPYYYSKDGMKEIDKIMDKYREAYETCFSPDGEYFLVVMKYYKFDNRLIKYDKKGERKEMLADQRIVDIKIIDRDKILIISLNDNNSRNPEILDASLTQIASSDDQLVFYVYDMIYNKKSKKIKLYNTLKDKNNLYKGEYWEFSDTDLSVQYHMLFETDYYMSIIASQNRLFYSRTGIYLGNNSNFAIVDSNKIQKLKTISRYILSINNNELSIKYNNVK